MNEKKTTKKNVELKVNKLLGKKIKRLEPILLSNNNKKKNPPTLSKATLYQIEKIVQKKKSCENEESKSDLSYEVPQLSLREQYENLLNRSELILPPKYLLLLKKQNNLDLFLGDNNSSLDNFSSTHNNSSFWHSYTNIQNNFVNKMKMPFNKNDFQQILFICPYYYIYQSTHKLSKGIELKYIDIPNDYIQRMNKKYNLKTNFILLQTPKQYEPLKGNINKTILEKRRKLFKKLLTNITLEQHQKFLKDNNLPIFDPIKSCTWHHNFNLRNIDDIGLFDLVENNINEYKMLKLI